MWTGLPTHHHLPAGNQKPTAGLLTAAAEMTAADHPRWQDARMTRPTATGEGQMPPKTHPSPLRSCQETAPRNRRGMCKMPVLRCTRLDACLTGSLPGNRKTWLPAQPCHNLAADLSSQGVSCLPSKKAGWARRTLSNSHQTATSDSPCLQGAYIHIQIFLRPFSPL